jgi:hypothetical protein
MCGKIADTPYFQRKMKCLKIEGISCKLSENIYEHMELLMYLRKKLKRKQDD